MRGRIALQKHFVRNAARCLFLFREPFGVRACPRADLVVSHLRLRADGAQITLRRSRNCRFRV
jgi:hypothetical protein